MERGVREIFPRPWYMRFKKKQNKINKNTVDINGNKITDLKWTERREKANTIFQSTYLTIAVFL